MDTGIDPNDPFFSKCVKVPDHVFAQVLGSETVLMSLESEMYFRLDNAGTRI